MRSLVPATHVAAFTSFARATSKAKKATLLLFSVAVLLAGGLAQAIASDYTVTTTGNAIVVTDVSGNSDILAISQPSDGNIKFAAASRTFSVNGGADITGDSGNLSLTGITSITVNGQGGNDTINVGAFTGTMPSLTINGGIGDDTVNFNGDITFAVDASLDVDLQNDDPTPGTDAVNVAASANLLASGTGTITVKASKNVAMNSGSSFETVNGNLDRGSQPASNADGGQFRRHQCQQRPDSGNRRWER